MNKKPSLNEEFNVLRFKKITFILNGNVSRSFSKTTTKSLLIKIQPKLLYHIAKRLHEESLSDSELEEINFHLDVIKARKLKEG